MNHAHKMRILKNPHSQALAQARLGVETVTGRENQRGVVHRQQCVDDIQEPFVCSVLGVVADIDEVDRDTCGEADGVFCSKAKNKTRRYCESVRLERG